MVERTIAEAFPPGEFIQEELEARGWTQSDLAEILGRPENRVNEIINGKHSITPQTAKGLASAFGTSPQFWMNLESSYQLWKEGSEDNSVAKRASIYSKAPVREMAKRRWIENSEDASVLEKRVLDFFKMESIEDDLHFVPYAARKSTSYAELTPAQLAWLFRARQIAESLPVPAYDARRKKSLIDDLRRLLSAAPEVRHVPVVLSDYGIRFVIVEHLQKTKIDGAAFWIDKESPVIAMSLRYDRLDNFWFTLLHELGHIFERHSSGVPIDEDLLASAKQLERPKEESDADKFSAETLLPSDSVQDFISRVSPLYRAHRIRGFANVMEVHPAIVVGRLQFLDEIGYGQHRNMHEKVRNLVVASTLTDGWGLSVPV